MDNSITGLGDIIEATVINLKMLVININLSTSKFFKNDPSIINII